MDTDIDVHKHVCSKKELQNFVTISRKNCHALKKDAISQCKEYKELGDIWRSILDIQRQCNDNEEEKKKLTVAGISTDASIKILKRDIAYRKEEICDIQEQIKSCTAELKDLDLEKEAAHEKLVKTHKALKTCAYYYKSNLAMYVKITENSGTFPITVCFFTQLFDDTYSVTLLNNETWELLKISPNISDIQFAALQKRLQETNNVSALIFTVQKRFKHVYKK